MLEPIPKIEIEYGPQTFKVRNFTLPCGTGGYMDYLPDHVVTVFGNIQKINILYNIIIQHTGASRIGQALLSDEPMQEIPIIVNDKLETFKSLIDTLGDHLFTVMPLGITGEHQLSSIIEIILSDAHCRSVNWDNIQLQTPLDN